MPDTWLNVDPDRVPAQDVSADDLSGIVEDEERKLALQHDERLRLRGITVPMRGDVRPLDHHVEESMGIIVHARVEVVIRPQARRLAGALNQRHYQCRVEKL